MQLSDLKKAIKGVDIVHTTPFNNDGSLDLEGMRTNIQWLLEHTAGKDFIYTPVGSTGEFCAMSDEECKAVIKMVVEVVRGQHVVMAGAGRAGTLETIKMCQYAESVGADGAMVVLPYYHVPMEEGMYQHYKQLAESVGRDFGIMIYNNSSVSKAWIRPPLMARLCKIPNIIAIKENTTSIKSYCAMQKAVDPNDIAILCGIGELVYSFEALYGCKGFISSLSNYAPDLAYSVYEAVAARDSDKVGELIDSIAPILSFSDKMTGKYGPSTGFGGAVSSMGCAVVKAAMDIAGLRGGEVRLPLLGLNKEEKDELSLILKNIL